MKKKQKLFIFGFVFLAVSSFFVYDIISSYGEFDRNMEKIKIIEAKKREISRDTHYIQLRIDRFSKDPKAAEEILRMKYKMLRPDQYYIPE
ncbi:hypothetical protein J5681_08720 [bacterium]|nr:hypothetical protein [bacterium]